MATVKFTIELSVDHSQVDAFKRLAKEMNSMVRSNEPQTIQCQWFFHEGDDKWYLTETFASSDAFLTHLEDAGPKLEEILEIAEVSRFEVFGELSHAAKAVIATFGVKYFTFWDGVNREAIPA
ncbi:MAG TPA: antibiotic biosynthesis monooxygenase [Flavitalea sp.]|nr:antibiotic biosynthesis monooxygenase [Flavitalea sp.]